VTVTRPSANVGENAELALSDPAAGYVSRSALKLAHALDHYSFDPAGRLAVDIGASTGGFTQVLLERGAGSVVAVDVGHDQLDPRLAADPRVRSLEGVNARDLSAEDIGAPIQALVSDVSFISQNLVLPPTLALCETGAFAVVLAKPQFEVGPEGLGKGGIVRDAELAEAAASDLADWLGRQDGWLVEGVIPSPIAGGDGNREFLIGAVRR
jgi:23S rRNA (cytidine1920-2'-O)/16S rRNA (cytidine1409-2'-O)-methyltransferase